MKEKINSILFATFSVRTQGYRTSINGMIEPILGVLKKKTHNFTLIEQPHPGSDCVVPFAEVYRGTKSLKETRFFLTSFILYPFLKSVKSTQTSVIFKLRDFFSVLEFVLRSGKKYDIFIGLEAINALAGSILKKLGYCTTVVYYVSDYSTNRYKPKWVNDLYLALDRLAATHSDYIWDVSLAMQPARIKMGLNPNKSAPVIHVPNALYPEQIDYLPLSEIDPHGLVFAGTLGPENGPDLAIEALKLVAQKLPKTTLHIYGGGQADLERLEALTKKLKLEQKVIFHGFFTDQVKLSKEIRKYALGLAPYKAIPGSPRWWADATKTRLYLASGLPVITTQVPPLGQEIERDGAGIIALDNPKDQAGAILRLLKNKALYKRMRANAIKRAKNNTWENTYNLALKKMGF